MIKDDIKKRIIECMKQKKLEEKNLLGTVLGEIQTEELRGKEVTEDRQIKIIKKIITNNEETIKKLTDRPEDIARLERENKILSDFVPKTLGVDEITEELNSEIDKIKSMDVGPATGMAIGLLKKRGLSVNGKDVSQAVRNIKNG